MGKGRDCERERGVFGALLGEGMCFAFDGWMVGWLIVGDVLWALRK